MKFRKGFVTNSSSSSFIVTNKSDKVLGNEDVARLMEKEFLNYQREWEKYDVTFEDFIDSSNTRDTQFLLAPEESVIIECGDSGEDGLFANIIHMEDDIYHDEFSIEYHKSHH